MKRRDIAKKHMAAVCTIAIAGMLVTGCGSYTGAYATEDAINSTYSAKGIASESYSYADEAADMRNTAYDTDENTYDVVKDTSMVIRNANISLDVKDLLEFNTNLETLTENYKGYIESSTIEDYENAYSTDRYAYYTVRIPNSRLDDFLNRIDSNNTVTSRNVTMEDVSLEYIDIDAHIKAMEQERDDLEKLMDDAKRIEDIISIKEQLTNVQYELDSLNGRMRSLKDRVAYSTVNLNAHEERDVEHPIRMALKINLKERAVDGISNAAEALVTIITGLPLIAIVTAFILIFIWILRKIVKKMFKKKTAIRYTLVPVVEETGETEKPAFEKNSTTNDTNMEDDLK